ncbi:MAG: hypothetical protein M1319_03600, partial [Chloroflexi bacterium]|nr:hypothetical protein [Chloroflexota bacterium]
GCNPLVSYVCNLEVLCQQFGYCGGGSVGGGGAPAPPSPPPAGQPPLAGMGSQYTGSINAGINVNLPWKLNFSFTLSLMFDTKGCVSFGKTVGGGVGTGSLVSGNLSLSGSNAQTNQDLSGPFANSTYGVSEPGEPFSVEGSVFGGISPHGPVTGLTLGGSLGTPTLEPVYGSVTRTTTQVKPVAHLPVPGANCGG